MNPDMVYNQVLTYGEKTFFTKFEQEIHNKVHFELKYVRPVTRR